MNGRGEYIAGLRELADYLEAHPAIPVPTVVPQVTVYTGTDTHTGGDGVGRAIVDQAAATFGTGVHVSSSGHREAARKFAGGLAYRVLHIPDAAMAEHDARQSYTGNIQVTAGTP